ncbi:MAG: crossover junction endodeoxyribonuclease ruvc [Pseudomonadota bacterium]|jgi:crossover junction endodeoxyribonuclease RuvC
MRILGIDPGLRRTGFGLIDVSGRHTVRYVGSGVIRPDVNLPEPDRLRTLYEGLRELLDHYKPQAAVVERVFVNVNPQSTLSLGQARGVAIAALASHDLPIAELTPLKVKQSIVGTGRASKEQVQHMVCRLLALPSSPNADAADALACALAFWHAHAP